MKVLQNEKDAEKNAKSLSTWDAHRSRKQARQLSVSLVRGNPDGPRSTIRPTQETVLDKIGRFSRVNLNLMDGCQLTAISFLFDSGRRTCYWIVLIPAQAPLVYRCRRTGPS